MRSWIRTYWKAPDFRNDDHRALEVRFGVLGYQGGVILPRLGFALWNRHYEPLFHFNWFPRRVV
jgi:hypothetical protein